MMVKWINYNHIRLSLLVLCWTLMICEISCQRSSTKKQQTISKKLAKNDLEQLPCIKSFDDNLLPIRDQLVNYPNSTILGRVIGLAQTQNFKPNAYTISDIKAIFHIYTRSSNSTGILFEHKNRKPEELNEILCDNKITYYPFSFPKLRQANFNASNPTVIMIPGYRTDTHTDWMHDTIRYWLELKDVNLILATWSSSNSGWYDRASSNTPYVAREITILLHYLSQLSGFELTENQQFLDNIHLIGHSLGAHIAGAVGRDFEGTVGRISGLDPAGPSFDTFEPVHRLDRSDAKLVDVYHSNSGKFDQWVFACGLYHDQGSAFNLGHFCKSVANQGLNANPQLPGAFMGINQDIGHVDYHLNSGFKQPGCNEWSMCCDHSRVTEFLGDALKYELELRNRFKNLHNDTSIRPLALKAPNYASFQSGANFESEFSDCKWLLNDPNDQLPVKGDLSSCSVPIDFVSSPMVLRQNLELFHGVKFSDDQSTRAFTATAEAKPLIGDHFLLKLKIGEDSDWDTNCELAANVYFTNKPTQVFKSSGFKQPRAGSVMTIPIRPVENIRVRAVLEKLGQNMSLKNFADRERSIRKYVLPNSIYFTSIIGRKDQINQRLPRNNQQQSSNNYNNNYNSYYRQQRGRQSSKGRNSRSSLRTKRDTTTTTNTSKCELALSYISIQPVWEKPQTFNAIFTPNASYTGPYQVIESSQFKLTDEANRFRVQPYTLKLLHLNQIVVDTK